MVLVIVLELQTNFVFTSGESTILDQSLVAYIQLVNSIVFGKSAL